MEAGRASLFAAPVESLVFREKSLERVPQFLSHILGVAAAAASSPCPVEVILDPRDTPLGCVKDICICVNKA